MPCLSECDSNETKRDIQDPKKRREERENDITSNKMQFTSSKEFKDEM
jgi:hypothetical protein